MTDGLAEIAQGSEEWKLLRLGMVTGSKVTNVMAKGKDGEALGRADYRMKLAIERLTGRLLPDATFVNSSMRWGTDTEPDARFEYEISKGVILNQAPFLTHPTIPWVGFSPDGLVGTDGLVEFKCPETRTHVTTIEKARSLPEQRWGEVIKVDYRRQCLLGLSVTGREWIDWNTYDPRVKSPVDEFDIPLIDPLFTIRIWRDDKEIKAMEAEIIKFNEEVDATIEKIRSRGFSVRGMVSP